MNAHTCDEFELLLPDALTGRLAPADAAQLDAHLAECSACRTAYDEFKRASAVLTDSFPARPESARHVWARVARSVQAQPAASAGRPAWRTVSHAAAAVVAVAALSVVIAAHSGKTPQPPLLPVSGTPAVQRTPEVANADPRPAPPVAPAAKSVADAPLPEVTKEHDGPVAIAAVREAVHRAAEVGRVANPPHPPPQRPARDSIDDALGLAVTRKTGALAVYDPEHRAWRGVVAGERIPYGWNVRTGAGGRAELAFGESRVRVDENTSLAVARRADNGRVANLSHGRIRVDLLRADAGFSICSAGGTVELTGTVVEVDSPAQSLAFVRVLEGHVDVTAKVAPAGLRVPPTGRPVGLQAGQETLLAFTATEQALRALPEAIRTRALRLGEKAGLVLPAQNGAANWDEELDRPTPKSAASVGQLIVRDEQGREAEPLGILEMNVRVSIRGPEALTRVDQVFLNQTDRTLEGTFYFPLPPGAAISRYAMYVNDTTLIEGEVVERGKAREIYESILHAKRDPALLEWMEGNLFKTRIFPIAPRGRKRVILEYTELLPAFYDTRRYVLPLVSELTQKTPIGRLTIRADLATNDTSSFAEIHSPSYARETAVTGAGSPRATAALTLHNCKPTADFVLTFSAPRPGELFSSVYAEKGEQPHVLLGYQPRPAPGLLSGLVPGKRDVLFIVETSGARTPQNLDAQARVLQAMVAALSPDDDRLAVAAADVSLVPFVNEFVAPNAEALSAASKTLAQRAPLGALDMSAAVRGAAEFVTRSAGARRKVVVFIGAGMPAYGVLDTGKLAQDGAAELSRAKASFVAVGVGRAVDALVLSELARRRGGFYRPLRVDEGLDEAAFLLALSLQTPVLEAPALECGALTAVCPENLGALLPGQEVFLHARAKTPLAAKLTLAVKGRLAGGDYARQFDVAWPTNMAADPAVGRFWARAWMDHLLAQPQTQELRRQVIGLAQTWTLMSPYTSFLVLEAEGEYARYGIDRRKRRAIWEAIEDEASFARCADAARLPAAEREREAEQFKQRVTKLMEQTKELLDRKDFRAAENLAVRILKMDPLNREAEELKRKAREAELAQSVELRIYDVSDLTGTIQDFPGPQIDTGKPRETGVSPAGQTGKGAATQAEVEELKRDIERLREEIRARGSDTNEGRPVDASLEGKYGPNATVTTRNGKLTVGGLTQAWYYSVQDERLGATTINGGTVLRNDDLDLIDQAFARAEGEPGTAAPKSGYAFTVLSSPGAAATDGARNYRLADLAEAIKQNVKPASWDDMTTSIEEHGGKLVVMQRPEMHEAIAKQLEELRTRKKAVDAAVARAKVPPTGRPDTSVGPQAGLRVPPTAGTSASPTTGDNTGGTVAVELTREQVAQLLAGTPKTPANAATRADLLRKLATLSEGIAGYRVLAEGIAEFGGAGPQAELLARELLIRVQRESNVVTLEGAAELVQDGALRARILVRRAALETDAGKRLALWERAYAESDKDFALLKPLCDSLHAAGKDKEVVVHLEAALRQGISQPWMWQGLTQAYTACGDAPGALRALTQAVALRPREAEPRRQLAAALEASGRPKEAVEQLRAACELSPDAAALHRELLLLATRHKDSGAREWALLAMVNRDWQPNDGDVCGEANRQLGELIAEYRRAGNEEKAKELERKQALAKAMDAVIVMSWDTDGTDVDLHVVEPHDHVSYQARRSFQGGTLDRDVTKGYGPETYTLRHGAPGDYVVKVHYFSGGPATKVQVQVTFKKGSPDERTQTHAVKLTTTKEEVEVFRFKL